MSDLKKTTSSAAANCKSSAIIFALSSRNFYASRLMKIDFHFNRIYCSLTAYAANNQKIGWFSEHVSRCLYCGSS